MIHTRFVLEEAQSARFVCWTVGIFCSLDKQSHTDAIVVLKRIFTLFYNATYNF